MPYNLQSAIAGLKNRLKIFPGKAWLSAKALKFWSCVSGTYEPRQIRKEAAVNKTPACRRKAKMEQRQPVQFVRPKPRAVHDPLFLDRLGY